jgi:Class III cytochrome C family
VRAFLTGFAFAAAVFTGAALLSQERATPAANPHGPISVPCENCHTSAGWTPLRRPLLFDHTAHTGFPLVQSHKGIDCAGCHRDLRFSHVGSACADCHEDPHRRELGFDCERCHTTAGWENRRNILEVHTQALFPLTGAHVTVECTACHATAPDRYFGAPRECIACHQDDLARAVSPPHNGFPRECETCHTTTTFEGANFPNHDQFFPIFSGPHRNAWDSCTDCHTSPNNFRVFSCITCHEHNREEMDDEHDDVRNYRYDSNSCLSCHPTGRE